MPIYESNGKRYSIPEDKVNDFLKAREGAKLVDETPFYLSNQQPQGSTVKQPKQQPNVAVQEEPKESTIDVSNLFSKNVARGNAFDKVGGSVSLPETKSVGHLGLPQNQTVGETFQQLQESGKILPKTANEGQSGFWAGNTGNFIEKLGSGVIRLGAGLGQVAKQPTSTLAPYEKSDVQTNPTQQTVLDSWFGVAQNLSEKGNPAEYMVDPETGVVRFKKYSDYWKEGKKGTAVRDIFMTATESMPTSIAAMLPYVGLPVVAMSAAGSKYNELDTNPELQGMSEWQKILNASVSGAVEGLTEKLGAKVDVGIFDPILKNITETTVKKTLTKGGINMLIQALSEGGEEILSGLGSNTIDYLTGVTDEWQPFEGGMDSFIYGMGGGMQFGMFTGAGTTVRAWQVGQRNNNLKRTDKTASQYFPNWENVKAGIESTPILDRYVSVADLKAQDNVAPQAKQAFEDYVIAKNAVDIANNKREQYNQDEIISVEKRISDIVDTAVNPQTNSIIIANVPGAKEVRVYGDIVLNEDGTINEKDSGGVFYTGEDGKRHVVSPKFVEILENTPADQAREESLNIVTEEIVNRQANEAVRPYEIGEVITFSTDGQTSLLGQVGGVNEDGTYQIAVDGMPAPLAIEPRMIIPEDNIRGIENGMQVQYRDQQGNMQTGIVNDAFGLRQQGIIDIDGNMVPTTNVIPIDEMTDIQPENEASPRAEADNMESEATETEQNDITPEQQAEIEAEQEKQAFMDSLPVFDKGKNQGEIDQSRMTPEQNVQYFEYTYGKEKALQAAEKQVANLKKRLKSEQTKLDNDPFNIKQNQKVEDVQTQLDAYSNYVNQEKQRLTEENIKSTPKSSIVEDRQARSEDIRQEEAGATGQADQSIIEKWSNAEKIEGIEDVITLSNGEKIEGRYVLTTADAPSPSHDIERNFAKTVGFPVNELGNTVNDRDYEADKTAQVLVQQRANNYDERAVQTPVVVSQDGVVLSGNDRTMAGQIAAINGTDGAYTSYIERYANRWGFTPEQVQSVQNPRIVFVPNNPMPYNTATFAKFNAEEKKTQNSLEAAIKASKSISREVIIPLAETIENFDKLTDFYSSAPAIKKTIDALLQNGVIQPNELPRLMDGNLLSAEGKSFLETIMLGSVLGEQALREVDQMRSVRQTLMRTMPQLFRNSSLKEYSLMDELNNAIHLLYEAKQNGSAINLHLKQGNLFELSAEEVYSETEKMLSLMLEGEKDTTFRNIFEAFNKKAVSIESGQVDLFDGIVEKPDLLKQILEIYGQQETESSEQAESPDGIDSRSEERREEQRPEEQSTDEGTGQQQEVEEPDSYIQKTVNRWVDLYEKGEYEEIFDDVVFDNVDANRPYIKPFEERVGITIPDISTKKKKRDFIKSLREKPIINIVEHANNVVKNEEIRVEADKTDTKPSEAQKEAGNYRKGHVNIQGFDITIENPAGSVRSGVNQDGTEWSNTMQNHYGYFKRTNGKDGDQIDVFVGDKPESNHIFVVDQINPETKEFDESKVMLGFDTLQEAKDAYLSNYEEGWQGLGSITTVDVDTFKEWAKDRKSQRKPFSEYRDVQSKQVPKEYGAENKGVTTEQYEELKQRMRGLLNNLNVGFNPEIFTIGAQMAAYHMEAGARKFADYATRMINDLGENVKPYLKSFYEGVRAMGNEYEGMDSYKYVKDFDVESLNKEVQEITEEKQTDNQKDDVPLRKEPQQGSLFDNVNTEEDGSRQQTDTRTDNRRPESDTGRLPESEQVPEQGVSSEDASRTGEGERMLTESSSDQPRTRHEYDVNREYSNKEIHDIVSAVTEVKDGKVEITGEITDDIKTIAGRYKSGGVAKEGRGVLDEYYTSERIVDAVGEILSKYIKPNTNTRALEPSVGIGNFIDAIPNKGEIISFEINETTARIAKILHPNIEVNLRPFETEFIDEKGNKKPMPSKYDIVVGNPPYGQHRGKYKGLGEESRISRYEDYFVKRGLDVLNENGILAMVLPSGWINRNKIENGYRILDAYRLPTGVFEGTDIGTDIVVLKKDSNHKSKENHNYFDSNPANILGETKERKNRFGRMEEYVDGDIDSAMDALRQNEAKKIASDLHIEPTQDNVNEIDEAVKEATTSDGAKKVVRATREKKSSESATKGGKINITPSQLKYEFKRGDEVVPAANQFPNKFSKEEAEAFRDTDYSGVFKNPEKHRRYANYYAGKWMHDFYYAEGNIYDRLEQLERDRDNISKEQYDKQRQMLQDVLPDQKTLGEININPNTAFVKNLNLPSSESEKTSLQDRFLQFAGNLPRDAFGSSNYWEVRSYVLNEQVYGQDKARNQLVRERRKRVGKDLFHKFLREELTDTQRKQVEYAFNREYNAVYRPDYAKVPMFSSIHKNFRGKPFELTEVQKAGIGRMTVKGVGVLAHEVGFGKTLSAILSMHEAMVRGYTKKPLIVVPNDSILKQWVETINDILPEATVNVLGNLGVKYNLDNFNVNDGEYTIVTYQGFKKLSFGNDVYDKLAQDFHYISDTDLDKQKSTRESEKEKADIEETVGKMQRQGSYSFEEAGFDYLTFDEIHNANHIVGKVKIDRNDHSDFRSQSQNTSDLGIKTWVAAQYIQQQNNGRNVLLLSATPFTNKPLEYYSILSLVANSTLKRMGFYQVDQFFETFMEADNDLEIAANGKAQQKTNVRRFRNNGLFNQLLGEYIDIKGEQDNPDLVRPERINKEYKIPQNNLTKDALARAQELLEDGETVLSGLTQSRLIAFSPYASHLSNESPQSHKEFVENSPKIHGTIKLIEQNRKDNAGAGQIVYSELGVDFFPYIRDYLINESKFKASEVAIIAGSTSATERARIQSEFNKGTIKVILGSPAIKEGMNLQENTTDMYILSLPYNFTQLRQVEGRGWRQGNTWQNIRVNYMLTNDSVDVFMLQRLQIKQGLYNEAMRQGAETIDVSDINTEELKNALITNPETRADLEITVERNRLEAEKERINADLAFILRKHKKFNELRSTVDQKRESIRNYEKNAEKDSWWNGYVEREKRNLLKYENDLQEEKLNIEKKGVNVDDIDNQIEKSNAQIQALDNEIEGLKGEYTNLVDKYRKEREELSKESGNLLERHLQERANENKGGFYEKRDSTLFRSNDSREAYAEREWNRAKNAANETAVRLGVGIDILETTDGLTGKKAEAKGWYDPETGKIVIVMPNHRSSGDVQATLLHETVGHHGLRELFGEHFDTFLDNVFNNADEGIQRAIRNIEKEQRLDRRTATEEYLSWLAEDGSLLEGDGMRSWFGKVKQFFLDMLAKVGINLDFRLSDNELRYILWRSYQNLANPGRYKTPSDQARNSAMQSELKVGSFAEVETSESDVAEGNETVYREESDTETKSIKDEAIKNNTFMKAPNGEPTSLNERQWLQVRTKAFKEWFGDWEGDPDNASKVVDDNGEPKVVYHGTGKRFTEFDRTKGSRNSGLKEFGSFFTDNFLLAGIYADEGMGPIMKVFLNIRNPKTFDAKGKSYTQGAWRELEQDVGYDLKRGVEAVEAIAGKNKAAVMSESHDGIIAKNIVDMASFREPNDSSPFLGSSYLVFDSTPSNIKSATDNTGSFNTGNNDIRFRMTQPPRNVSEAAEAANSSMTEQLRQEYDRKYSKFATRFREAWEDMYLPVKQFLDVLRENGIEVAEYNDFYKQATALSGKNDAQLDHFRKAFQKPITEQISNLEKLGFEYRDIENYVFAKHGLERNDYMAKQQAKEQFKKERDSAVTLYEKGAINDKAYESRIDDINQRENDRYLYLLETKDYAGLTALTDELQQSAEDYIIEFEDKAGKEATDGLWDAIKKATDYTLDRQYKSGMIKKETLDELRSRYDNYVPLRGHDETTAEDRWDYTPDMGTYFSAPLLKAHGRRSRAESPFAYIEQMAHSAITWGNKNDLKQTMLRLARTDTKGLMSASQTWYRNMGTKEDPRWEQVSAEYNENVDQYLQNQRDFEEQMRELHVEGMAFQSGARKLDIGGIFIKPKQAAQHELRVYQNGTSYTVYINANPAVAQAINGSNRKDISKSLGAFSTVTRNMAANFTTRNPLFVLTNFSRDYIFASSILTVKESPAYAVKFQRNIPNAMGSLQRYIRGKLDMTNPNDVMMYEYIMNGAKTGFSSIFELDRVAKKLKREAEKGNKKKSALDYGRNVLDVVDSLNEIAENMSRLSVYITSRKEGRSITQSVHDAKNVTVNFNQKGAGSSAAKNKLEAFIFNASRYVRPLYLFSNAAIQSLSNFSKVAVKNPKGMSALVASYALSGFIAPFLAGLIGGDDGKEDYMKLSDWERQNNWCIWLPNGFVKIPLPHELRVFHRMGDNIYQAAFENRDIFQTLLDVSMGFSDLLPVNPLGATDASWAELVPDAIRPFVQLETNTNFMGSRIYDKWARKHAPGYQKVRTNKKGEPYAPKALIGISKWVDNTTGGDGVKKGVISPPNPDIVHHLARGYFGGLYTLAEQGINIIAQAYSWTQTGDLDLKIRQTPLRTFYADANDLNIQGSGLNSRYWKVTDDILKSRGLIKGYSDQLVNGEITHDAFQEKIKGLNVPLVNEINDYIKTIRKYENALKEMNSDEQKEAERIISDLKKTVIELGYGI